MATVKGLWKGGGEKTKALLTYCATPLENGYSPAQLLMGRQLRTTIPQLPVHLQPHWPNIKGVRAAEKQAKVNQQRNYDHRHQARPLPTLRPGQNVWLRRGGERNCCATSPKIDEGLMRRNRTHLRALQHPHSQPQVTQAQATVTDTEPGKANTPTLTHTPHDQNTHHITSSGRVSRPPVRLDL